MGTEDFWDKSAQVILEWAYGAAFVFAAIVVMWQSFHWLKTSFWQPISMLDGFFWVGLDLSTAYLANNWLGLAKIAQWLLEMPLSLGFPILLVLTAHILQLSVTTGTAK